MQVALRNRFLILASTVPPVAAIDAGALPNVPVHQLTTFHVASPSADPLSHLAVCWGWTMEARGSVKLVAFLARPTICCANPGGAFDWECDGPLYN